MHRISIIVTIVAAFFLTGCKDEEPEAAETPVRGLKTFEISETEQVSTRRFPGVLEPSEISTLSFEIGGTVQELDLDVGQRVSKGQVVARLDTTSLALQVQNAQAGVDQARASAENAADTLVRQTELLEKGATTRVSVDNARTESLAAEAALEQAQKSLESAEADLGKASLEVPYDGVVNTVDATSFATVGSGTAIASIYAPDAFTVSFSVNFDTVDRLVVGKKASIRLADRPDIVLPATVSEIGSRADSVSSFPIVLELDETHSLLKAGMAVETAIEFALPTEAGYPVPLSALIRDGQIDHSEGPEPQSKASVYVYDPATESVKRRNITVGGIRENRIIILQGLEAGDLIASAGVSFLTDGQKVRLLQGED